MSKVKSKHMYFGLLFGALMCGAGSYAAAEEAVNNGEGGGEERSARVNVAWLPDPTVPTIFMARENGLFAQNGLDPEFIKLQSGPAMFSVLRSESADIGSMGLGPAVILKSQGVDIQIVLTSVDVSKTNVLVAREPVEGVDQLRGKRIASVKGATPYYGLNVALNDAGMSLADIDFVDLAPANIIPAFTNNDIDAAWVWSPWQNHLVEAGGHRVITNADIGAAAPNVWVVRTDWAEQNTEALVGFLKAIDGGINATKENSDRAAGILASQMQIEDGMAQEILSANAYYTIGEQLSSANPLWLGAAKEGKGGLGGAAENIGKFFKAQGKIPTAPSAGDLINSEPAVEAANATK